MSTQHYFVVGMIVVLGSIVFIQTRDNTEEYTAPIIEEVQGCQGMDCIEDEDARAAAEAVIRRKELEAELADLTLERDRLQDRIEEIEKELGTY